RDARQGMPQLKVGHLRALPAPPAGAPRDALERLGRKLGEANAGASAADRARLDALVAAAYGLDEEEAALVARWAALHPPPLSRRASSSEEGGSRASRPSRPRIGGRGPSANDAPGDRAAVDGRRANGLGGGARPERGPLAARARAPRPRGAQPGGELRAHLR